MSESTRRELLAAAAAGGLLLAAPPAAARRLVSSRSGVGLGHFRDGVASGEPSADRDHLLVAAAHGPTRARARG